MVVVITWTNARGERHTQVQNGDPAQPDIPSALQGGQWFIGVDVGAHQAAHKLLCSQGWI